MTTQTVIEPEPIAVIGGVDTHKNTHYAAVLDDHGRLLASGFRVVGVEDGA